MKLENTTEKMGLSAQAPCSVFLTDSDRNCIVEILERRANDIASFKSECVRNYERMGSTLTDSGFRVTAELPGSVDLGLSREIQRLRRLADKVRVPRPETMEDDE